MIDLIYFIYLLVLEMGEGGKGERERERNLLFHSFLYSLGASCICPKDRTHNLGVSG